MPVAYVTVIIPTYNYGHFIAEALDSIFAQYIPKDMLQVLVVDDGSEDETDLVVRNFAAQSQLLYLKQVQRGKAAAVKAGLDHAEGEIIFMLDADDWFLPGKISATCKIFEQNPHVVHVASPAKIVWEEFLRPSEVEPVPGEMLGRTLKGNQLLHSFYTGNFLFGGGSTFAARASVLKRLPWNDAVDMYLDEWLVLHTLLAGDSYFLPQPLSVWRVHGKNYSGSGGESLARKQERLRLSSEAVMDSLKNENVPEWLQRAYRLKHEIRLQAWMEQAGTKTLRDKWAFFQRVICHPDFSWQLLWRYKAFNRLLK